jgi:hypothetical protein
VVSTTPVPEDEPLLADHAVVLMLAAADSDEDVNLDKRL